MASRVTLFSRPIGTCVSQAQRRGKVESQYEGKKLNGPGRQKLQKDEIFGLTPGSEKKIFDGSSFKAVRGKGGEPYCLRPQYPAAGI